MFQRIIQFAVANRLLLVLALFSVSIASVFVIPKLNLDAFPDVTNVQVTVNTEAPGLAATEVEQLITYPIESVMYALPDVKEVRSISKTGLSGITVVFDESVDIYFARQLVFERLQAAKELIPEGVGTPEMGPNSSGLGQVYQYLLLAEPDSGVKSMELRSLNDYVVKLLLMPVEGITEVLSFGGKVKQYQVNLNPAKLLSYELTQQDVMSAVNQNNGNVGGWYMPRGQEQLVIRGTGWLDSGKDGLEQLRQIPLKTVDGVSVTLGQVADVEIGSEIRQGAVSMSRKVDGEVNQLGEVVSGIVLKRMGSNTKATIDGIKQRIPLIQQALPDGVKFEPYYDQADLIQKAVSTVAYSLLIAFIFIIAVLALFLLNLRATFLVLLSIPVSIAIALMVMSAMGMSANLMSLGGIAVAIGMLVDGSVVMVENIFKHLSRPDVEHKHEADQRTEYRDPDPQAAELDNHGIKLRIKEAANEVARPVFFAAMIILVVFMPLFSFQGVEAKLFEPMAISIMLAIVSAVFVAIMVVPALASYFFSRGIKPRENKLLKPLDNGYKKLLRRALAGKKIVIAVASVLFVGALLLVPRLGTEFAPELEEGTINIRVTLAPSSNLETALAVAPKLEKVLMEFPETTYALSRIGRAEVGGDPEPISNIEIYVGLKPQSEWITATDRYALQEKMEAKLDAFPGLLFNFSQPIATRVDELLSGVKSQLAIKLFGPDLDILASKGEAIEAAVKEVDGAVAVAMEQIQGEAQLVVSPKRQQLSRYGLNVADVLRVVDNGLGGASAGQIIRGNERYDIYVRLAEAFRDTPESIRSLRLLTPSGAWVTLGEVANVAIESGPPQIRRDDVQRRVVIQSNVQGRDMGSVVTDIRQAINEKVDLPSGYSVDIGGQFESQQRAQQRLSIVVPISLTMIAFLLYFAFGTVGQAMLILVNVPLAVIGGIVALYVSGQYLSVPSAVGFITLFGVAVLNGVVLVESINQRITDGHTVDAAVFDGAWSRLRPVLMTAITSALGLIPMLFATGAGAEIQRPLATVIVGGLVSATLLTLVVLPVLYPWFSKQKVADLSR
ncbi:efflux RND transporter permease subunit [Pseudidiomarina homiensis]|uniref:CusA/CzcA family heavy metal efflux RND transporter n=1 Tax=Pseudidiomarina homiensis TaxID=364198 RepID=A0A432Y3Z9_9GAMM|nr:CusA/CzcA family heavy metal efflux RND transporter [Pseudidiomarina homiensis]RUO55685.1 CusA/CzcA family heavy metal efflux RND transporter [Pseudidiomarina homiensis]